MSDPVSGGAVLQTGQVGETANAIRKRDDRRHLLTAVAVAMLFHLLIVLGFLLADLMGIHEMTDWSGPVLVKIGAPEAPESSKPDPGPLPDQSEEPVPDTPETPEPPPETPSEPVPESSPPSSDPSPEATRSETPVESGSGSGGEVVESPFAEPREAAQPAPARAKGDENGNNYEINFDGSDNEVGRAGAYGLIVSYMPLPEILDAELIEGAAEYLNMSPGMIRDELEQFWEPVRGDYVKRPGSAGNVPYDNRPYIWGILENSLGYDMSNPEWKTPGMRSVTVEFTVNPSRGTWGAELTDFEFSRRSNNPAVDEAVIYGLSRWVYYNDTGKPVRGRITYDFGD